MRNATVGPATQAAWVAPVGSRVFPACVLVLLGGAVSPGRAAAQWPVSSAIIVEAAKTEDAAWYASGLGSLMRQTEGGRVLLQHPDIAPRVVSPEKYLVVRFFEPSGYPISFQQVGLRAVRVLVSGELAYTFGREALDTYDVFHGWAVLLPLREVAALVQVRPGVPVEFQIETTAPVHGAVSRPTAEGDAWITTFRAAVESSVRHLRIWVPVAVVAFRPVSGGYSAAGFPVGLAVGYRLWQSGSFYLDLAAVGYLGVVRATDNDLFLGLMNGGGLLDFGGWFYLGATWVGDHRKGRSHPGLLATGAAGHKLISLLAGLVGY